MFSPQNRQFEYVEQQAQLDTVTRALKTAPRIALDIEANSLHHYYEKVCLIQLTAGQDDYIIDPLAGLDLADFLEMLTQKELILHCGDYDLRMLKDSFGFRARGRIFDTMLAAKLLGYTQFSLADMVERFTGHTISKKNQKSNWNKRPLTANQLDYARYDTVYLATLAGHLETELEQKNRRTWHDQSVQRMLETIDELAPFINCNRLWRIKGTRDLTAWQLALLRELWWWREVEASLADKPPFRVITNENLIRLTGWLGHNKKVRFHDELDIPGLPRDCRGTRFDRLLEAIQRGLKIPRENLPGPLPVEYKPDYPDDLFEQLRSETARLARPYGIEPSIIAPRSTLGHIASARPETLEALYQCAPTLLPWQAQIVYEPFMHIIQNYQSHHKR